MTGREQFRTPDAGPSTLAALRLATAAPHTRIEALLDLDQPFPLTHYARIVQGFGAFVSAWEPLVAHALPPHLQPWFEARCRGALLQHDLRVLRLPAPVPAPLSIDLPCTAAALGSLYVMEGSALGGQVIAQRLRQWHGIGAADGAAYFAGWGQRTAAMWREFQQVLQQETGGGAAPQAAACTAAVDTFDALGATFQGLLKNEPAAA